LSSERGIAAPLLLGAAVLVAIGLAGLYVTLNSDEDPPPNGDAGGYELRAIGDSVTAGFGYFGNGDLMPLSDLLGCKPAAVVSNRCSSNSNAGPDYTGPAAWSPDFGFAAERRGSSTRTAASTRTRMATRSSRPR